MSKSDRKQKLKQDQTKTKTKKNKEVSQQEQLKNFYREWKTVIWISLCVFLAFYLKLAEEEGYSRNQSEDDLYGIMDLSSNASIKDIKKQFNKLVIDFHPDRNPNCGICEEKFGKISKAYEVLSKEDSKNHYD